MRLQSTSTCSNTKLALRASNSSVLRVWTSPSASSQHLSFWLGQNLCLMGKGGLRGREGGVGGEGSGYRQGEEEG